jgi:hypothetical protein
MVERFAAKLASLPAAEADKKLTAFTSRMGGETAVNVDPPDAITWFKQTADSIRELARVLTSSSAEDYEAWLQSSTELQESNPMARILLPSYDSYLDKMQRAAIKRQMMVTALAVVREGADALQSHPDPTTGQSFIYTETADGFELQSGYQTNGIPLKMQFK